MLHGSRMQTYVYRLLQNAYSVSNLLEVMTFVSQLAVPALNKSFRTVGEKICGGLIIAEVESNIANPRGFR